MERAVVGRTLVIATALLDLADHVDFLDQKDLERHSSFRLG
jgi:hypothetical protein